MTKWWKTAVVIEWSLTSHSTHYRSFQRVFTGNLLAVSSRFYRSNNTTNYSRKDQGSQCLQQICNYRSCLQWEAKVTDRESDKSGRHIMEAIWISKIDNMNRDERSYQWATYGTSFYILMTATGSQSWWRLPTRSENDNKQSMLFWLLRVINIVCTMYVSPSQSSVEQHGTLIILYYAMWGSRKIKYKKSTQHKHT